VYRRPDGRREALNKKRIIHFSTGKEMKITVRKRIFAHKRIISAVRLFDLISLFLFLESRLKITYRKRLRADYIWGILANIQFSLLSSCLLLRNER
jgi:hypothetical protein